LDTLKSSSEIPGKLRNVVMEKISWTDRVRNEEVLRRVKEERNIIHTVKIRKVNWIGHILCRNCFLNILVKEKEVTRI
jgi:hypothetical protein